MAPRAKVMGKAKGKGKGNGNGTCKTPTPQKRAAPTADDTPEKATAESEVLVTPAKAKRLSTDPGGFAPAGGCAPVSEDSTLGELFDKRRQVLGRPLLCDMGARQNNVSNSEGYKHPYVKEEFEKAMRQHAVHEARANTVLVFLQSQRSQLTQ